MGMFDDRKTYFFNLMGVDILAVDRLLLLHRECQEIPFFEKSTAHRTAKSNYVVTMLDRVISLCLLN